MPTRISFRWPPSVPMAEAYSSVSWRKKSSPVAVRVAMMGSQEPLLLHGEIIKILKSGKVRVKCDDGRVLDVKQKRIVRR